MNIEVGNLITLSDKNEYAVADIVNFNNILYYYIVDINNELNLKFCYREGNELVEVTDTQLLVKIISLVKKININGE